MILKSKLFAKLYYFSGLIALIVGGGTSGYMISEVAERFDLNH